MNQHTSLVRHIAHSAPELSPERATSLALFVIAWLVQSRSALLPAAMTLANELPNPTEVGKKIAVAKARLLADQAGEIDENEQASSNMISTALQLEGEGRFRQWAAMDALHWAAPHSPARISLSPGLADLLISLAMIDSPEEVYLPYEHSGQLTSRLTAREVAVWVETTNPLPVKLGIAMMNMSQPEIHLVDPVTAPSALSPAKTLKSFAATVAVLDPVIRYAKTDLANDLYSRSFEQAASGAVSAIRHMLAQTTGRLVLLVPDSVLFSAGSERNLRKQLVAGRNLEAVIKLPEGMARGISPLSSILVLRTEKSIANVLFIEITQEYLRTSNEGEIELTGHRQLMSIILDRRPGHDSAEVAVEELAEGDCNIEVSRHITKNAQEPSLATGQAYTFLTEHFDLIRPRQHHTAATGPIVYEVLANDLPDFGVIRSAGKESRFDLTSPNASSYFLRKNDVLICIKGAAGKVGCIAAPPIPGEGGWVCGQSIAILRSREGSYDPQALMMYLRSPAGQAQLARMVVGTTVPTIQNAAFKQLKIPILNFVQTDMVIEALDAEVSIQQEIDRLKIKQATIASFLWQD